MMNRHDDPAEPESDELRPPSRSARKREAEALQRLGVRLVGLREPRLKALQLDLPDTLLDAVREARLLKKGPALARQYQYIGRLMRDIDPLPIEAALERAEGGPGHRGKMRR